MITVKRDSDAETSIWIFRCHEHAHTLLLRRASKQTRRASTEPWSPAFSYCRDLAAAHHLPPRVPTDVLDEARRQFVETLKAEG